MIDKAKNPEVSELALIPANEAAPKDVGTLSVRYQEGVPVLVLTGGKLSPAQLTVTDASGKTIGAFSAQPKKPQGRIGSPSAPIVLEAYVCYTCLYGKR